MMIIENPDTTAKMASATTSSMKVKPCLFLTSHTPVFSCGGSQALHGVGEVLPGSPYDLGFNATSIPLWDQDEITHL
jgi:hypothetical protein